MTNFNPDKFYIIVPGCFTAFGEFDSSMAACNWASDRKFTGFQCRDGSYLAYYDNYTIESVTESDPIQSDVIGSVILDDRDRQWIAEYCFDNCDKYIIRSDFLVAVINFDTLSKCMTDWYLNSSTFKPVAYA
jgi:hypothetical protein